MSMSTWIHVLSKLSSFFRSCIFLLTSNCIELVVFVSSMLSIKSIYLGLLPVFWISLRPLNFCMIFFELLLNLLCSFVFLPLILWPLTDLTNKPLNLIRASFDHICCFNSFWFHFGFIFNYFYLLRLVCRVLSEILILKVIFISILLQKKYTLWYFYIRNFLLLRYLCFRLLKILLWDIYSGVVAKQVIQIKINCLRFQNVLGFHDDEM